MAQASGLAAAVAGTTLSIKLLVDTKSQRVLYAEVGKDVVDFLHLLALPAVKVLTADAMTAGSIGNLCGSIADKLDVASYGRDDLDRRSGRKEDKVAAWDPWNLGGGDGRRSSWSNGWGAAAASVPAPSSAVAGAVSVQGDVTYTLMDDLKIAPMSAVSGISLMSTFGVKDVVSLQVKTVQLGFTEGLEMMKVAMQSKTVLTDVFFGKTRSNGRISALARVRKSAWWCLLISFLAALGGGAPRDGPFGRID